MMAKVIRKLCYHFSPCYIILIIFFPLIHKSSAVFHQSPLFQSNDMQSLSHDNNNNADVKDKISCRDEKGDYVDWFIVYKLPKVANSQDELLKEGNAHFYLLPKSMKWTKSTLPINDTQSLIGRTLGPIQIYDSSQNTQDLAVILYNDQPPNIQPTIKDGHTKGVIVANSLGSFWMPHSIPHFPKPGLDYYPTGGLENGQILFCLSIPDLEKLNDVVGGILHYTKATFYNSSISSNLQTKLPKLMDAISNNKTRKSPPWYEQFKISAGELDVTLFAKGPKFHREIYADWIAPYFNTSMDVQSWLNGAHPFLSNCTSNCSKIYNIMQKQMIGEDFSYINDHSKWGVSTEMHLICITDLNRMKPQKGRGGVGLCFKNDIVWSAFKSLVTKTQPCGMLASTFTHNVKQLKGQKHLSKGSSNRHHKILKLELKNNNIS